MAWTEDQDKYLTSERARGASMAEIASAVGRSQSSVKYRLWRLANQKALFEPQGPTQCE